MGGAGNRQREQQGGDNPLSFRRQDPGDDGPHGVTTETQHHGNDGPAAEPDLLENTVDQHGQARQVAGIFYQGKHQEERSHNGKHNGYGIADPEGDDPVIMNKKVLQNRPGNNPFEKNRDVGGDIFFENVGFEKIDQCPGPKPADELVKTEIKDHQEYRKTRPGIHGNVAQPVPESLLSLPRVVDRLLDDLFCEILPFDIDLVGQRMPILCLEIIRNGLDLINQCRFYLFNSFQRIRIVLEHEQGGGTLTDAIVFTEHMLDLVNSVVDC